MINNFFFYFLFSFLKSIDNIGILHAKESDIKSKLNESFEANYNPFNVHPNMAPKQFDLKKCRLCFQVRADNGWSLPVISDVITHSLSENIVIERHSPLEAPAHGNVSLTFFFKSLDRINKRSLRAKFYEGDDDNDDPMMWSCEVDCGKIHKKSAVMFDAPPYKNQLIRTPVQVNLKLFASACIKNHYKSDESENLEPYESQTIRFVYKPNN